LLYREDVYFRGGNPFIFDIHVQVGFGDKYTSEREILRDSEVYITTLTTDCFLIAVMDYKYYIKTQLPHSSYTFKNNHDWMMVKVAFPNACNSLSKPIPK